MIKMLLPQRCPLHHTQICHLPHLMLQLGLLTLCKCVFGIPRARWIPLMDGVANDISHNMCALFINARVVVS